MNTRVFCLLFTMTLLATHMAQANTLTVQNLNDSGAGSLRAVITQIDPVKGGEIFFKDGLSGTITLTTGELTIDRNTQIIGKINGTTPNRITVSGNGASRVFHISTGTVTIFGLTISDGLTNGYGGAITNHGILNISSSTFTNNKSFNPGTIPAKGGAIYNSSGSSLNLKNCTFSGNLAYNSSSGASTNGHGGAIFNDATATLTINNCTFDNNTAGLSYGEAQGGAIFNGGSLFLTNSTFCQNKAACSILNNAYGGAIFDTIVTGQLFVQDTTFSLNTADGSGGGIATRPFSLGTNSFGGVFAGNTIIASNIAFSGPDVSGEFFSEGYNLIGKTNGGTGWITSGPDSDQTGSIASPLDPLLGSLENNGGQTKTMALLANSAAIDTGFATTIRDQRGVRRGPPPCTGFPCTNYNLGYQTDIGAYELNTNASVFSSQLQLSQIKWENSTNWLFGLVPNFTDTYAIRNPSPGGTNFNTILIDATTTASFSNTLTVSGLTVGGNIFALNNAGTNVPLHVLGELAVMDDGTMSLANSALRVDGSNSFCNGNFTIASGSAAFSHNFAIGSEDSSFGTLNLSGGTLSVTNGVLGVGNDGALTSGSGNGVVTVSNATLVAASILLGSSAGGSGKLIAFPGGNVIVKGGFSRNKLTVSGGTVEVQAGPLPSFEDPIMHNRIVGGYLHDSEMEISAGIVTTPEMLMGVTSGTTDTLTMSGGSLIVYSNMWVGNCASNATGVVDFSGGTIHVTNTSQTAVLDVRNGTFVLNGGTLVVDTLIITNSCGHLVNNGGTLIYSNLLLAPNLDADGDGLSNGLEQYLGMNPLNPSFLCTPPGLVAWWPTVQTNSGWDIIGAHDGTLLNGVTIAPGKVGNAFSFDGVNDYISVPHDAALNAYPLTAEAWIKTTQTSNDAGLINKYLASSLNGWQLYIWNGEVRAWYFRDGSSYVWDGDRGLNGGPVNDGQWHHVAFTVDASGGKIYVDGILKQSLAWTGTPGAPTTTQELRLGDHAGSVFVRYYAGLMDEPSIFNQALSGTNIADIYLAGSEGKCLPPVYITHTSKSATNLTLSWLTYPRFMYRMQYTTNLDNAAWTDVIGDITATNSISSKTDVVPADALQRFYRIEMLR